MTIKPDTTIEFMFAHYPMVLRVENTRLGRFICENKIVYAVFDSDGTSRLMVFDQTLMEWIPYGWNPVVTPDVPDRAPKSVI